MSSFELRTLAERGERADEESFRACLGAAFGSAVAQELIDEELDVVGRDRALAAFDGSQVVGTAASFKLELTLPGGGFVEGAGITSVTTLPTHRRQGVLSAIMRRQLTELFEAGVPCAVLTASEGGIYERYGYGVATYKCRYKIDKRVTRLRPGVEDGSGRVRLATPEEAARVFPQVWEEARLLRPGEVNYPEGFWRQHFHPQPPWRQVDENKRFFAFYEEEGRVLGCVDYQVVDGGEQREVDLDLHVSLTLPAYVSLWRFLLGIDLTPLVSTRARPLDEPLQLLVDDPRRLAMSSYQDGLWLRPLDVVKLLEARRYPAGIGGALRLGIRDSLLPSNAAVYELELDGTGAGVAKRSGSLGNDSADLELDVAQLGSVLLGGVSFGSLRAAGLVVEDAQGATWRADAMFASDVRPFLTLGF